MLFDFSFIKQFRRLISNGKQLLPMLRRYWKRLGVFLGGGFIFNRASPAAVGTTRGGSDEIDRNSRGNLPRLVLLFPKP